MNNMDVVLQPLREESRFFISTSLTQLQQQDPSRAKKYAKEAANLYVNFSNHWIRDQTLTLLFEWAEQQGLSRAINALRQGDTLNTTEQQAALHPAHRDWNNPTPLWLTGHNVRSDIYKNHQQLSEWVNKIHQGPWTSIIHIGIGGSDLGQRLAVEALEPYQHPNAPSIHFVSGIDDDELQKALKACDPQCTLITVASKSFTTLETQLNAIAAKNWLIEHHCDPKNHLLAITAYPERAENFGILPNHILKIGSWIGGRYSLWSNMGFIIAVFIGMNHFEAMLAGAKTMDEHFFQSPFSHNIPVWMGLLSAWYRNYFHVKMQVILPYAQKLAKLPSYLQQLDMESCGKSCGLKGQPLQQSGMAIWGQVGTQAQHAFNQWIHQGTETVLTDFIVVANLTSNKIHGQQLIANAIAQQQAMTQGHDNQNPHKKIPGNRPSTMIIVPELSPTTLGSLLALYEHKVFTQSVLWQLNPFDQYGVELGKEMAKGLLPYLKDHRSLQGLDSNTQALIERFRALL